MTNLTLDDILCAYKKLKTLAYHDNSDLYLRWKLAECEYDTELNENKDPNKLLKKILRNLKEGEDQRSKDYWDDVFSEVGYYALPKQVKTYTEHENEVGNLDENEVLIKSVFTNQRELTNDSYDVTKVTLFIDAPIEAYILSILWIMKIGQALDLLLDSKCFGNRLKTSIQKDGEPRLVLNEGLFKPYYQQYQLWRDEGISTAKHYLEKGEDVLFINLDIKDYYYSVRLRQLEVQSDIDPECLVEWEYLDKLFWRLHKIFTSKIKRTGYPNSLINTIEDDEYILPIGLPSSYVLANWYLIGFDKRVNEFINPIYYSRYVDDIFIVTAKNDIKFDLSEKFDPKYKAYIDSIDRLRESEKYVIGLIYPVLKLRNSPYTDSQAFDKAASSTLDQVFALTGYKNLFIQASKTLIYFFDANSSLALLDKFKNEIEKRSSEFRFLPDDELEKSGFDDEAYELVFDDSQHKIKTLKDYRESRYGIASHLSKKIYYTLRNGSRGTDEDAKKIMVFFKGTINLEHYRQWERLLTYLLVNDKKTYLFNYLRETLRQLENISLSNSVSATEIKSIEVKYALIQQFILSFQLVRGLDPNLTLPADILRLFEECQRRNTFESRRDLKPKIHNDAFKTFRHSNLIRHNYISIPLLNYIEGSENVSLIEFSFKELKSLEGYNFDKDKLRYSPRRVRYGEVAWMQCISRVLTVPSGNARSINDLLFNESREKMYLDASFETFYKINFWNIHDREFKRKLKEDIFQYEPIQTYTDGGELEVHELEVKSRKISRLSNVRVGLANMKVDEKNYSSAMLNEPNLNGRYKEFAKILNMAEHEKCDIVALPELALPPSLVRTFLEYSWKNERCVITGLEHWTQNNIAYNFVLCIIPCNINGVNDAVPILRLKNHYSPAESFWIEQYDRVVPKPTPNRYHLIRWRGLYFSIYYCFELSDIYHRSIFKAKVDFILAAEWNPDVKYFSNIAESSARDLHCYFIQVNTNQYGDSRIIQPSKNELKDLVRIQGGKNTTLLTGEIDIERLRAFQYMGYGQQKEDGTFKPTPADYSRDDVRRRHEGRSFKKTDE
ncbi:RNA-directed DNA polymerase [Dyadobacter sp. 32]|uniref:RNA-directed DNA polymerase n=1 Tax=Dyadobacter sp. 32 TaxID=538966 RepID=UPI0011EE8587